jgi:hypothetical protein
MTTTLTATNISVTTAVPSNSTNSFPTPTMTLSNAYNPIPADVNSDGKCDFITSSSITYSQNGTYIYLNNGNGGFNNKSLFFDADVTLVDFNNDNLNDLLLHSYGEGSVMGGGIRSLDFSMNSNGAYFSLPTYLGSYSNMGGMNGGDNYAVGDFNADGRLDVVTTSNDSSGNNQLNVSIFINNGKNGFNTPVTSSNLSKYSSTIDSTADFNGDKRADLLIGDYVLLSDGTGSFGQPITVDSNTPPMGGYHIADFNGDGAADLYSGNYNSDGSVLINDGKGHFNSIALNANDMIKGTADFNGDGKADLIVSNYNQATQTTSTSIRINDGSGRFGVSIPVDGMINAVADFNGDGRADLILGDSAYLTTSVRMNDGYGNFGNSITVSGSILSSSSMGGGMYSDIEAESKRTVADFNGDGRPDLITQDSSGQPYSGTINIFDSSIFSGSSVVTTTPSTTDTPSINHAPTGSVAISGTPIQAQTLTIKNTLADADGLGDFSYQWLSNGAEIFGATNASYVLSATDIGKKISVQVSYLDSEGTNELIASDVTTPVSGIAIATNGNDQITGTAKAEKIDGLAGNDLLSGLAGNDTLIGSAGLDTLIGGAGADNLTGGNDADIFKFTALADSGITSKTRDTITDFTSKIDKIDLSAIDANEKLTGDQAFSFINSAAFSKTNATGQLRFDITSKILYGSTDADIAPEFSIQFNGVSSLVAGDFVL